MRIVLVNWAKIWDGAEHGGGVNQYCQALALALKGRGHEVISLFGGTTYTSDKDHPTPFIRRHDDWFGVRIFEVVNSPVIAPSLLQFAQPMGEVSSPTLEAEVRKLFAHLRPDVVHWNNVEGFSIGCVEAAKQEGARNVFSLHNYHTICPQVYLMQKHRETCWSFDNGHACTNCVELEDVPKEKRRRIAADKAARRGPAYVNAVKEFRESVYWAKRASVSGVAALKALRTPVVPAEPALKPTALPAQNGAQPIAPQGSPEAGDWRGKSPFLMAELNPPKKTDWSLPQYRPLSNEIRPEPPSDKAPNDYAKRRAAMVAMLNGCDRVLAVSDFVRRKFVSMGVREDVIRAVPIGSRINRVIALKPDLIFDPPPFDAAYPRPIRLHFMGYHHHYKGLSMLIETLESMRPEHLQRIDLSVYALGGKSIEWMFRRMEPRLAKLTFGLGYNYHDIPWMLGGKDITLVPSVWWDNAPQTVFESLSCGVPVLGADIGGIPDFVKDGVNGRLFRANDRADLRRVLVELIERPQQLTAMRANVKPTKSIEMHAEEMEAVYAGTD